jgi:hypothetical protein
MGYCENGNKISGSIDGLEFLVNQNIEWKYFAYSYDVDYLRYCRGMKGKHMGRGEGEFVFLANRTEQNLYCRHSV